MLNSLLILGSTYSTIKKANKLFAIIWIIYMLLTSNFKTGLIFIIMNFISFTIVFIFGKIFENKYSNTIISIFSILIWSIIVDIICYFIYPQFTMRQNILMYIGNGILFNYKYAVSNALFIGTINAMLFLRNKFIGYRRKYGEYKRFNKIL